MEDPYTISLKTIYPNVEEVTRAPFVPKYRLKYASKPLNFWKHPDFSVVIQAHDAYDCYISILEIKAKEPLILRVHTHRHDLHWLYQLKGKGSLKAIARFQEEAVSLYEGTHLQLYCPPEEASLEVKKNHFLLVILTIKGGWIKRYRYDFSNELENIIWRLEKKEVQWQFSKHIVTTASMLERLTKLLLLPLKGNFAMDADIAIHVSAVIGLDDFQTEKRKTSSAVEHTSTFRTFVRLYVETNKPVTVAGLSDLLGVSTRYLLRIYRKRYPETPQQYISEMKFTVACERLIAGQSIKQLAYDLGYSAPAAFSRQFKKRYGIYPRAYQQQFNLPGNDVS